MASDGVYRKQGIEFWEFVVETTMEGMSDPGKLAAFLPTDSTMMGILFLKAEYLINYLEKIPDSEKSAGMKSIQQSISKNLTCPDPVNPRLRDILYKNAIDEIATEYKILGLDGSYKLLNEFLVLFGKYRAFPDGKLVAFEGSSQLSRWASEINRRGFYLGLSNEVLNGVRGFCVKGDKKGLDRYFDILLGDSLSKSNKDEYQRIKYLKVDKDEYQRIRYLKVYIDCIVDGGNIKKEANTKNNNIKGDIKEGDIKENINNEVHYLTKNITIIKDKFSTLNIGLNLDMINNYCKNGDEVGLNDALVKLMINKNTSNSDLIKIKDIMIFLDILKHETSETDKSHQVPKIETLDDIYNKQKEVIKYVESNKDKDHIYFIKSKGRYERGTFMQGVFEVKSDFYIAGSAALNKFNEIPCKKHRSYGKSFEPGDTDIFIVNSDRKFRSQFGSTDIVYTRDKTIEDLLLNFDLPCCRVATNPNGDYWISAQCLYAILTGKYFLPEYLLSIGSFYPMIEKYPGEELKKESKEKIIKSAEYLHKRLLDRIEKYSKRGFTAVNYQTDVVLNWIIHRLDYSLPTVLIDDHLFNRK